MKSTYNKVKEELGGTHRMKTRIIIDGNAIYEVDEECLKEKKEQENEAKKQQEKHKKRRGC